MADINHWFRKGSRRDRRINKVPYYQDIINDAGNWSGAAIGVGFHGATSRSISFTTWLNYYNRPYPQSQAEADAMKEEMRRLTPDQAKQIYKEKYWDKIQGDRINSQIIAELLADSKSSAGGRGVQRMQMALNELGENLKVDGNVGAGTLAAINRQIEQKGESKVYNTYRAQMLAFYQNANPAEHREGWIESLNEDYPPMSSAEIRASYPNGGKRLISVAPKTPQGWILALIGLLLLVLGGLGFWYWRATRR